MIAASSGSNRPFGILRIRQSFGRCAIAIAIATGTAIAITNAQEDQTEPGPADLYPVPEADLAVSAQAGELTAQPAHVPAPHALRIAYYVDGWERTDRRQIHLMLDSWAPAFTSPLFPKCEFQLFDSEEALADAVRFQKLDAVCLYAFQMPFFGKNLHLDPGLLIGPENDPQLNLVILVRRNSGIKSISDLSGKEILMDTANLGGLPALWLRHASNSADENPSRFLSHTSICTDSFNAISPVFFGNADACIVTQRGFTQNAGLNPQVLQRLTVLARSPAFATRVLAFPEGIDRARKAAILALRPTLRADPQNSGFLTQQSSVFYDIAEGDFAAFRNLDPASLPPPPGSSPSAPPSLRITGTDFDPN